MTSKTPTEKDASYLQLIDVYKSYGSKRVLDNLDLDVDQGELCTLVGPSGCGKSTMFKIIVGDEPVTSGKAFLQGKPITVPDVNRGLVFQRYSLFPHLSVIDNVGLGLHFAGINPVDINAEAMSYLDRVRLGEHANKYPHQLSGGMQQRVAIAQSLIMKPKILMMDEPFGALDPDTREDMQLFLLELWEQEKMTIFFITHDLEEAAFIGSRILVLSQYYTDDRGNGTNVNRGSKIIADYQLSLNVAGTSIKKEKSFKELITQIREEGFNPEFLQHARDFNLKHPDSFQTLSSMEDAKN